MTIEPILKHIYILATSIRYAYEIESNWLELSFIAYYLGSSLIVSFS